VRRKLGVAVLVLGLAVMGWVGVVMVWGDPFTSLYTAHEQQALAGQLAKERSVWAQPAAPALLASQTVKKAVKIDVLLRRRAARYEKTLHDGQAMGRIVIPRIGLKMIVVEDLMLGRGLYFDDLTRSRHYEIKINFRLGVLFIAQVQQDCAFYNAYAGCRHKVADRRG